ncbi:nuclear transport factor 2 family protein [Streptomyces flavofungini]|uniref:nuclear transport factor 2 family protein n=1 Tax=Streptomyces flavofungini TaxID=68200 RepID=UPI0025B24936|nr:nuclear transport factor 2 family protein [Streptomyces flavofungini]WJV45483.1 nuclear transport factor 2 family protein [Streptomyces flavofungini]
MPDTSATSGLPDLPGRSPAVEAAIENELRLLDPEVRASPALFGALLHPEFTEFGASGARWDRESIVKVLTARPEPGGRPTTTSRMRGVQIAEGVVHLTFDTDTNGRLAHRSSLWRRTDEGWLLWFHQGTPFTAEPPPAD